MGRLREIPRTATFAWSTDIARPCLATGTRAGAVDADFSDETKLELWDLDLSNPNASVELQPVAHVSTDSRFYDLAWSQPTTDHEDGIIAGGLESGSLDLWDAKKLKSNSSDARISRTTKHTAAIKALQFNPHRKELLATSGAKGELYITDLNNVENPFRLGGSGRADDFDTLDWNNKKVPHIMVTGGSGGFITVWDVRTKKESLTLNNHGRKPVSAVAWNPEVSTKLATAVPLDQDPLILMWDLRNSSAPEKILRGHEQGVLSLSWCTQDVDLLLSCGKDNRNICWNTSSGEMIGEFPIVTNWTFQTRWNSQHPNLLATASFDGKIGISTIQNTRTQVDDKSSIATQPADGADFFAKAQSQPQASTFSLPKPPGWLKRPAGASFGFGGKLISYSLDGEASKKSKVSISTYTGDAQVSASITGFQNALKDSDFSALCDSKIENAPNEESKNDWKVIKTLLAQSPRKGLLAYLGYTKSIEAKSNDVEDLDVKAESEAFLADGAEDKKDAKANRSSFFDNPTDGQNFLADLASTKGARTNNPFRIFTGSESDADKKVTKALMLGDFEQALDLCLKENRMSDAFMIAICGGQKCIDMAQAAYFGQQSSGPNYLRLLASVVGKNLWDVVHNADLDNWQEVMATLCTYADETEFPDLCETLGDRLEEAGKSKDDASFCYLAGSKLDKVVPIWIQEMRDNEKAHTSSASDDSAFSVHVQSLQTFIEKVSIFRSVTKYEDKDGRENTAGWKLEPLYSRYAEYADIVSTYGYLDLADQFLSLLPAQYPAAEVARNRIRQASKKGTTTRAQQQHRQPSPAVFTSMPTQNIATAPSPMGAPITNSNPYPSSTANKYTNPAYSQQPAYPPNLPYTTATPFNNSYGPPAHNLSAPPSQTTGPPPTSKPPGAKAVNGSNWNDLPDSFAKPISRRGTPGVAPPTHNPYQPSTPASYSPQGQQFSPQHQQPKAPLPPPPKAGSAGPPRAGSPQIGGPPPGVQPSYLSDAIQRPPSSAANSYAPQQQVPPSGPSNLAPQNQLPMRTASPYNLPPTGASANRYAPAPSSGPTPGGMPPMAGGAFGQPGMISGPPPSHMSGPPQPSMSGPPPSSAAGPPPRAGPPPAAQSQSSRPSTAQSQRTSTPGKFPSGDRSHIPPEGQPIYDGLNAEMQRIKGRAPASFRPQVEDTERRINLLFDLLNNDDLKAEHVARLRDLTAAVQARDFDSATTIHTDLMKQLESSGPWMVGIKRLISMSKATPLN